MGEQKYRIMLDEPYKAPVVCPCCGSILGNKQGMVKCPSCNYMFCANCGD